ncbi:hypothetical protein GSO54_002886 [Salmonella enterica]|uniref:hypothetical protein n=1 Tax=Enterobacter sp. TaxID=42895 RepID=UPI00296F8ABC|nr:hypothetical protein [Enterobacter sp.]EDT2310609.1 hypothetical protein [Salmonella enterica]
MKAWRWEEYKKFFQLTIFRYFVLWFSLVPAIAVLFEKLPNEIKFQIGQDSFTIKPELPFSWQLLWLSSLFFVIALASYYIFCPRFIMKYNNYGDYLNYHHDHRWMSWEACYLLKNNINRQMFTERVVTKKFAVKIDENLVALAREKGGFEKPIVTDLTTDFYFENNNEYYKLSFPHYVRKNDEDIIDEYADKGMFYEIFGRYSASKAIARFLILALLSISFFLFIIVLLQHIYHGGIYIFSWVKGIW